MITAGIREVKSRLSSLLAAVRSGEEVFKELADTGFLTLRDKPHRRDGLTTYRLAGKPLSLIVSEDRR